MKYNVLITGANSGLGRHLTAKFESQGHSVLSHKGRKHYDLREISDIKLLAEDAIKNNVRILINNAAVICPNISFGDYNIERINAMVDVNLKAPILLSYLLFPHLTNIININSMVGLEVKSPRTLYSATKWGLRGFSNSLKKESKDVSILDIYPTNIKTTPDRLNAMDVHAVVDKIYNAFIKNKEVLILDGRKQ